MLQAVSFTSSRLMQHGHDGPYSLCALLRAAMHGRQHKSIRTGVPISESTVTRGDSRTSPRGSLGDCAFREVAWKLPRISTHMGVLWAYTSSREVVISSGSRSVRAVAVRPVPLLSSISGGADSPQGSMRRTSPTRI